MSFSPEEALRVLHRDGFDVRVLDALRRVLHGQEGVVRPVPGALAGP